MGSKIAKLMPKSNARCQSTMKLNNKHAVNNNTTVPPFPNEMEIAMVGMGCFWGPERLFWQLNGVYSTQVGYSGGTKENPSYGDVCSGSTGHAEVVRIVFDPNVLPYEDLLKKFWENHNPTQIARQGNDVGTQYRSGIYYFGQAQRDLAERSKIAYQKSLSSNGYGIIATEIIEAKPFYYAENWHQQYLHKNPSGYCGGRGLGVRFSWN